jgi:hypothetical protein
MRSGVAEVDQQAFVEGRVNYLIDTGDKPVSHLARAGTRPTERDARFDTHTVRVRDARAQAEDFSLEREGFVLARHHSVVTDFYDDDQVRSVYYPETAALVQEVTGAAHVHVFDHTVRAGSRETQVEKRVREPVHVAHNDYTDRSAPRRVRDLLPEGEAEERLKHRFAVVQVWRPIAGPVLKSPLGICDARSIAPEDVVFTDLQYQNRTGEVMQMTFNPDHRWFYIPRMTPDEALVFKCYDSMTDGRARFTAHSAFDDPTTPAGAPDRESIEMRTFAFF